MMKCLNKPPINVMDSIQATSHVRLLWYAEVYLAKGNAINLLCQPLVIEGTPAQDVEHQLLLSGPFIE